LQLSRRWKGMGVVVKARYENGVFKPLGKVSLEEGTVLEIDIPESDRERRSIKNLGFVGIWEDRKDIEDGVSYVDRLRDNLQT